LIGAIGISATFFLFAGIGIFAVVFVWHWVPETK
jgi:predicted MFS family arabinose efflux permease